MVTRCARPWKSILTVCLMSLLATGCGPSAIDVQTTRQPATATASRLPTQTSVATLLPKEVEVHPTPTESLLSASATPEPTHTETAGPTLLPTATEQPPPIEVFTVSPSPADPTRLVTLVWKVPGADSVSIQWLDKRTETGSRSGLSPVGSMEVDPSAIKFSEGDLLRFSIYAFDAAGEILLREDGELVAETVEIPIYTELEIASFSAGPDPIERSGQVTLSWSAPNAVSVGITRLSEEGDIFLATEALDLPAQGSIALQVPDNYVTQVIYYLGARDANGVLRKAFVTVGIRCPYADYLAPQCPLTRETIWAAYEPFEHGHMVWRSDRREIWVLYDGGYYEAYDDTYQEGQPSDIEEVPPQGLFAPVRGFGKVWATLPWVRARLGWATGPESGYDMLIETRRVGYGRYPGTVYYFRLPDDKVVQLTVSWSQWEILP